MAEGSKRELKISADVAVQTLETRGIEYVFGIPGQFDSVFNSLLDPSIKTVVCRHEQNAASIVGKIGRMTGKAGVAIATSGHGVSSLVTAWRRQTPALVQTARPGSAMLAVELAERRQWAS